MTGRWPANVILTPAMADMLDRQSGSSASPKQTRTSTRTVDANHTYGKGLKDQGATFDIEGYADSGGASRFFLTAGYEPWELDWITANGLTPADHTTTTHANPPSPGASTVTPTVHEGHCLDVLRTLPDNSVDCVVTDPPYGLSNTDPGHVTQAIIRWANGDREYVPEGRGFMGQAWDRFVPPPAVWDEALRVLKPGGHLVAFAGSRTQDLMGLAIRLAGFDIRENVAWLYGSGFPKSLDISKAIDKAAGAEREVIGTRPAGYGPLKTGHTNKSGGGFIGDERSPETTITAPATPEAEKWQGWGTALKPAHEPIILARKPFPGTVAANVLEHGTGGLNIDATRIGTGEDRTPGGKQGSAPQPMSWGTPTGRERPTGGRWPANVVLDPDTAEALDQQTGNRKSGGSTHERSHAHNGIYGAPSGERQTRREPDEGGASRFFTVAEPDPPFKYAAKAPKRERPSYTAEDGTVVQHPTVKPLSVIRWLVKLVCPPGGTVLDMFAGTGTTGEAAELEGFNSILIEGHGPYIPLIHQRLARTTNPDLLF